MKNEASDTTMLAVTVIALAVVVSIGFGIFMFARSSLNSGSDNLNSALDTVNNSSYADYDQKTVSGTKVLSCLQNFEGTPCAILIRTKALATAGSEVIASKSAEVDRYYVNSAGKSFINYNAILGDTAAAATLKDKGDEGTAEGDVTTGGDVVVQLNDGTYLATQGFYSIGGVVQYYGAKGDYQTTGMTEYIAAGTRFTANLIKDASGTTLGVVFEQIN